MRSGDNVTRGRSYRRPRQPLRHGCARVVGRAATDAFADAVLGIPLKALTLMTPWVTDQEGGCAAFGRTLAWAERSGATVHLITRPPATPVHTRAVERVLSAGGRVTCNPALHAKVFIGQFADGRRVALLGSANLTAASSDLLEAGVLIQSPASRRGPDLVDDLLAVPVRQVLSDQRSRTLHPSSRSGGRP